MVEVSLVEVEEAGRYTNVYVRSYMVASIDHEEGEVAVYGVGDEPLEQFEVDA